MKKDVIKDEEIAGTIAFGNRLTELRRKEGCSQEELAERLDVTRQTISKWENGQSSPDLMKALKLSKVFKMSVDELITGNKNNATKINIDANTENTEKTNSPFDYSYMLLPTVTEIKKKNFIKRNWVKIIAAIMSTILVSYGILCVYRFWILKDIKNKFESNVNFDNYYYERQEIIISGGNINVVNKYKYWYRDGILKIEIEKAENGITGYIYEDYNSNEKYVIYNNDKKFIKTDIKLNSSKNLMEETILLNYNSNWNTILNIFNYKIYKDTEHYIIKGKGKVRYTTLYSEKTGLICKNYQENENDEEIVITNKFEFNNVTTNDIKMINLLDYEVES